MNPIPAIRLIAVLLFVGLIFSAGWMIRGWKSDRDIAELKQTYLAEKELQARAVNEAVASIEDAGRRVASDYETKIRNMSDASDKLRRELRNAESKARKSGAPACHLDPEWVRLYNASLQPPTDPGAPPGKPADPPQGADPAYPGSRSADQWDVAWLHTENASRWSECRAQLNALIDFVTSDVKGVVTQQSPLK